MTCNKAKSDIDGTLARPSPDNATGANGQALSEESPAVDASSIAIAADAPNTSFAVEDVNEEYLLKKRNESRTPQLSEDECTAIARTLGISTNIQARNITGGFGNVFITEDENLNRKVAVKVLFKNWHKTRLEREKNAVRALCGQKDVFSNLVTIYGSREDEKHFYYTMECANNCAENETAYAPDTLERRIRRRTRTSRPSPDDILGLFNCLMDAVQTLHSRKMAHLDIKPDNIFYIGNRPKLGDYSLISATPVSLDAYGGSPSFRPDNLRYMSETTVDGVDCDCYALGKVLYCYTTGEQADSFPKTPPGFTDNPLFKRINKFLLKACNSSEEMRFHDIQDFRKGFENCFQQKKQKRHFWLSIVLPLAVIALVALLDVNYRSSRNLEKMKRLDFWRQSLEKRQVAGELASMTMPSDMARFKTVFSGTMGFDEKSLRTTNIDIFGENGEKARHFAERVGNLPYFSQTGKGLTLHLEKGSSLEIPVKMELPDNFEFAFLCSGNMSCHINVQLEHEGWSLFGSGGRQPSLKAHLPEAPFIADLRLVYTDEQNGRNAILYVDGAQVASSNDWPPSKGSQSLKLGFKADGPGEISISMFKIWKCNFKEESSRHPM